MNRRKCQQEYSEDWYTIRNKNSFCYISERKQARTFGIQNTHFSTSKKTLGFIYFAILTRITIH